MPQTQLRLLGRMLDVLGPLIETADTALRDGRAELDGFDDLVASGPLERLVVSELVWLKLNPSEFARRVVEREALRRRPEYRDRSEQRAVLLAVDSGARMLGALRLPALAGMLALAASAHRRSARFLWTSTGFGGQPEWVEGLSRRGLSRFIRQTGVRGLDEDFLSRAADAAPAEAEDAILWTIGRSGALGLGDAAGFHLQLEPKAAAGRSANGRLVDVAVRQGGRLLRSAALELPDDQICADTLRAPFSRPRSHGAHRRSQQWAPSYLTAETAGAALYARVGGELVVLAPHRRVLRIRLRGEATLLGVRYSEQSGCILVWRRDDAVHYARLSPTGMVTEGPAQAALAPTHPLLAEPSDERAIPGVIRVARRRGVVIASPGGLFYVLRRVDRGDGVGLDVEPVEHMTDLTLLAQADGALLCAKEQGSGADLFLASARRSERIRLRAPEGSPLRGVCAARRISDAAGVLVGAKGGWRWLAPHWRSEQAPPAPPAEEGAVCLGLAPPFGGDAGQDKDAVLRRPWSATFWSPARGFRVLFFDGAKWSDRSQSRPAPAGRVLGLCMFAGRIHGVLRFDDDGGAERLAALGRGGLAELEDIGDTAAFKEAPCVSL